MGVMDVQGKRNLVVADEHNHLLGIVSDGDLRRALIRGIQLTDRVDSIMQSKPIVATSDWSATRILACMERYQLLLLPVVDVKNKNTSATTKATPITSSRPLTENCRLTNLDQ